MAIEPAKIKNLGKDQDMGAAKITIENLRTAVNQLRTDADTLITQADSLQSQIDAIDGRVDDLEDNPVVPGGSSGYVQFNDGGAFTAADTMYWDKTNKRLGINHTAPEYSLHILKSGANAAAGVERASGAKNFMSATDTYSQYGSVNNYAVRILVNSTAKMIITTGGDVCIGSGVTSAAFKLDVQGTCGISDLKTPASGHPTNYKSVYVDTDTGKLYCI